MTNTAQATIGWFGLGRMGDAMVKRLLKGGFAASVWNRTAAKAAPLVEYGSTAINQLRKSGGRYALHSMRIAVFVPSMCVFLS